MPKFQKKRPKGQRWRENRDGDEFDGGSGNSDGVDSAIHVGGEFKNPTMASAFEGLTIPTAEPEPQTPPEAPAAENLPEPPPEVQVV